MNDAEYEDLYNYIKRSISIKEKVPTILKRMAKLDMF